MYIERLVCKVRLVGCTVTVDFEKYLKGTGAVQVLCTFMNFITRCFTKPLLATCDSRTAT